MSGEIEREKQEAWPERMRGAKARLLDESGFIFIGGGGGSGRGCLFWIFLSIFLSVLLTVGVNLILLAF